MGRIRAPASHQTRLRVVYATATAKRGTRPSAWLPSSLALVAVLGVVIIVVGAAVPSSDRSAVYRMWLATKRGRRSGTAAAKCRPTGGPGARARTYPLLMNWTVSTPSVNATREMPTLSGSSKTTHPDSD